MDIGNNQKNQKGFTLVEILVVLVIFSIMLTAISSIFISGVKVQQSALATERLLDQLNYAIEYMGKAIMMAKKASDSNCITSGYSYSLINSSGNNLGFLNKNGSNYDCIYFRLNTTDKRIWKGDQSSSLAPLTSDDVKITNLTFNVSSPVNAQPKVTILIEAEANSGSLLQKVRVETTISQRDLNK